jgi:hypothetical protein
MVRRQGAGRSQPRQYRIAPDCVLFFPANCDTCRGIHSESDVINIRLKKLAVNTGPYFAPSLSLSPHEKFITAYGGFFLDATRRTTWKLGNVADNVYPTNKKSSGYGTPKIYCGPVQTIERSRIRNVDNYINHNTSTISLLKHENLQPDLSLFLTTLIMKLEVLTSNIVDAMQDTDICSFRLFQLN